MSWLQWSHLIRNCEDFVCKKCKSNQDNHAPARYPSSQLPAKQQCVTDQYDTSPHINWSNSNSDPTPRFSVSTTKPNHISELLEATRKLIRHFKKSYKNGRSHQNNTDNNCLHKSQSNTNNTDKHVHRTHSNANQVNEITGQMHSHKGTKSETENPVGNTHPDSNCPSSSFSTSSNSE